MKRGEQTSKSSTRQRPRPGDMFAVPLGDGTHGFGQVCWKASDCAFFDLRSESIPAIADVASRPVIFRTSIDRDILTSGSWPTIGNAPLAGDLAEPASYRNQPVGSNQLYLYRAGELRKVTVEEVRELELLAVWFEEHVVERLLDHFAGRVNRTVEYFGKIKVYGSDGQEMAPE